MIFELNAKGRVDLFRVDDGEIIAFDVPPCNAPEWIRDGLASVDRPNLPDPDPEPKPKAKRSTRRKTGK